MHTPVHCSPNLRPQSGGWTKRNDRTYTHPEGWTCKRVDPRLPYNTQTFWLIRDQNRVLIAAIDFPEWELP